MPLKDGEVGIGGKLEGRYSFLECIRQGNSSIVYKAWDSVTKNFVAIKMMEIHNTMEGVPSSVIREVSCLMELDHPNIIRLMRVVSQGRYLYLVFEYQANDLAYLLKYPRDSMNGYSIKSFLHQILQGVAYCHSARVIHRDLKPVNVLVDLDGKTVKVGDFGLAKSVEAYEGGSTPVVGTYYYKAPELLLGLMEYSTAVDIWSVGCIFGEMVSGKPLFPGVNSLITLGRIVGLLCEKNREDRPFVNMSLRGHLKLTVCKDLTNEFPGLEPAGVDLISKMLRMDPDKRITAAEALQHGFFKDVPGHS